MLSVYVDSIGLLAPGLSDWEQAQPVLRREVPYVWDAVPSAAPAILAPAERRRCIATARLALTVAHQALQAGAPADLAAQPACVFASSDGDSQVIAQIMESLAQDTPDVSPIRFANSVHNAPAGYWSIATGLMQGATCLSAYDDSFAAGLLEAATQVADEDMACLLTVSDVCFQPPFFDLRPIAIDCGAALLLRPESSTRSLARLARLDIVLGESRPAPHVFPAWLPAQYVEKFVSNPAVRALSLLTALAAPAGQIVELDYLGQTLSVRVSAC
ncbi:MAG: beta-ketoacyl synthase chain length factor [Burkholderiaceae bacterium]|nr:beta-ketoacyl synthase chain length factor [Burkholderiaceae bacterium]